MAQQSIMSILLFVCLSLSFGDAQSRLRKNGDKCYSSDQCNSGCCFIYSFSSGDYRIAKCRPKEEDRECVGPDDGDPCVISLQCKSGCCRRGGIGIVRLFLPRCVPRAAENATCSPVLCAFPYYTCPCEIGLICQKDQTGRPTCKKPDTANN